MTQRVELATEEIVEGSMWRRIVIVIGFWIGSITAAAIRADDGPQLEISTGRIAGEILEVDGETIHAFKGIPFALPPTGELRWRPPQPASSWEGVKSCREFAPACPQPQDLASGTNYRHQSEDCLYLNIWTPVERRAAKLPVMVWIHGGGNLIGGTSATVYDGRHLARAGVVLVSIQYRLGPFGYFVHPELAREAERLDGRSACGNYGLLDQVAALRWVQENIAAFGGDPGCVTVFGESAGAANITYLMASPLTRGLFHRAIIESGYFGSRSASLRDRQGELGGPAMLQGIRYAQHISGNETASLEDLRRLPVASLLDAPLSIGGLAMNDRGSQKFVFRPVLDGYLLTEQPAEVWNSGRMLPVPIIAGSLLDDGSVFSAGNPIRREPAYRFALRTLFGPDAAAAEELFPVGDEDQIESAVHRLITIFSFRAPARRLVKWAEAAGSPSYLYHFTRDPQLGLRSRQGVFHGLEIPYVFGTLPNRAAETDWELSRALRHYWTEFARSGDPNGIARETGAESSVRGSSEGLSEKQPVASFPVWPRYQLSRDEHLEFGDALRAGSGLDREACDLVDQAAARQLNR